MNKLKILLIVAFLQCCCFNSFAKQYDVDKLNGVELRIGNEFAQYYINKSTIVFTANTTPKKKTEKIINDNNRINLVRLIKVTDAIVDKFIDLKEYQQPIEIVFLPFCNNKKMYAKLTVTSTNVVRIFLSNKFQDFNNPKMRKLLFKVFLLAKYGCFLNEAALKNVPDWLVTAMEKEQRFFYRENVIRDDRGRLVNPTIFRNYIAVSSLIHSNGKVKIEQIVDHPVPNEDYAAIYEAYSEFCNILLNTINKNKKIRKQDIITKNILTRIQNGNVSNSKIIYNALVSVIADEAKRHSILKSQKFDYTGRGILKEFQQQKLIHLAQQPLTIQHTEVDIWFNKLLEDSFVNNVDPYNYHEIKRAFKDVFNVRVELFNDKMPITSDIIVLNSRIKLEKLLYNLDKINNITIVLDDLISQLIVLQFKTSFYYNNLIKNFVLKLKKINQNDSYQEYGAEKFEALVKMFKKELNALIKKDKQTDELLKKVENNRIPPWYLYYYEFYSQDFFDAVNSESSSVKKLLDDAEKIMRKK
ncbi:hypothetical protein AAEX28_06370 [Lentisphaerota bacterium WC36G]|nr:hypothetical protein LJT99_09235 [Lentisphaerae bacterium WC36]